MTKHTTPTLKLVEEHKLHLILRAPVDTRLEASGICTLGDDIYVVFDNMPAVARIGLLPLINNKRTRWFQRESSEAVGYEDLTYDPKRRRFYSVIESARFAKGIYKPRIAEFDARLRHLGTQWVDFDLEEENKGLEGIAFIESNGEPLVLCLCEGNKCKGGKAGRTPGGGRVHAFRQTRKEWEHVAKIKVPKSVAFTDYASMETRGNRVVFVSQESAAVWVGEIDPDALTFVGEGQVYEFPRDKEGKTIYCNIEGVSWVSDTRLVCASDKAKAGDQPRRCYDKEMSIHVFDLP
jgi:hypothetical protein